MQTIQIDDIINFWFEEAGPEKWYKKDDNFDLLIAERFELIIEKAVSGEFVEWQTSPRGCLALCILLDQFPRNIYRNSARSFAYDAKAREIAFIALDQEFDRSEDLSPEARTFLCLPFEHHENLSSQYLCLTIAEERIGLNRFTDYAKKHLEIIKRFGRFPHRNVILERKNTFEESKFLEQPGSGF